MTSDWVTTLAAPTRRRGYVDHRCAGKPGRRRVCDVRGGLPMRAVDLAAPFPTVGGDTLAVDAARLLATRNLPGLIVVDARDRPLTILPSTQVLRMAVPQYIQDDPPL